MGQSSSSQRGRRHYNYSYHPPPPPPPPPPPSYPYFAPNPSYYSHPYPYNNSITNNSFSYQLTQGYNTLMRLVESLVGGSSTTTTTTTPTPTPHYSPQQYPPAYNYNYAPNHGRGSLVPSPSPFPSSSAASSSTLAPPPQYVETQKVKTVKNDVNVHKDTIRLEVDENNKDQYLVSFVFDAMVDGSVTVCYYAREENNCNISPVYGEMTPKRFPFQKGLGQKFRQPSGSGIDLGFFELDDLSKPLHGDVFPLVIYAQASSKPMQMEEQVGRCTASTCAQITQAVLHKTNDESFQAKVIKQILWTNGERYELQEIFGLANSTEAEAESNDDNADDSEKECVICLSEPRSTAVLPCRHMCMCSECAKALRLQSNKCPICRQPVQKLMEISMKS